MARCAALLWLPACACVPIGARRGADGTGLLPPVHIEHRLDAPPVPGLRYRPSQYMVSACDHMGTVGGVYPTVLGCAVEDAHGRAVRPARPPGDGIEASAGAGCVVRPLPGFAYNPSIVPAPAAVRMAMAAYGDVRYVGTTRAAANNRAVACANPWVSPLWKDRTTTSGSDALLLDAQLRVLGRAKIRGGVCANAPVAAVDARLLNARGARGERELRISYSTFGGVGGFPHACRGHWLSTLELSVRANHPASNGTAQQPELLATISPTDRVGGGSLDPRHVGLYAERNGGLLAGKDGNVGWELVETAPSLLFVGAAGDRVRRRVPPTFFDGLRNSIHPLWIDELGVYLGVAHHHVYNQTSGPRGHGGHKPFQFGYFYRHVLYTLGADLSVVRYSREFCLPALERGASLGRAQPACEGVQFVMGAFRQPEAEQRLPRGGESGHVDGVTLVYGVMDCESASVSISLAELGRMLEFEADDTAGEREAPGDAQQRDSSARGPQPVPTYQPEDLLVSSEERESLPHRS